MEKAKSALLHLNLAGAKLLTDAGLSKVAACGRLSDLNVSGSQLTSEGFKTIVLGCPNLVKLDISSCVKVTSGLANAVSRCNKLTYVYANKCYSLHPDDALKSGRPVYRRSCGVASGEESHGKTAERFAWVNPLRQSKKTM